MAAAHTWGGAALQECVECHEPLLHQLAAARKRAKVVRNADAAQQLKPAREGGQASASAGATTAGQGHPTNVLAVSSCNPKHFAPRTRVKSTIALTAANSVSTSWQPPAPCCGCVPQWLRTAIHPALTLTQQELCTAAPALPECHARSL